VLSCPRGQKILTKKTDQMEKGNWKLLIFVSLIIVSQCFITDIPASELSCFSEFATMGSSIALMFQVISGGNLDVDIEVQSIICCY
jgi:hypothetical protein